MDYLGLAKKLIAVPSTADNSEALKEVLFIAEEFLRSPKITIRKFKSGTKPSLVATLKNTKTPDVFLNGHLDVVPANPDQFKPIKRGNKLFGRGAQDMKAACAVMAALLKKLSETKTPPSVGLMFVTDEETGGFHGTGFLVSKGFRPRKIFLAGESTSLNIEFQTKGVLWLKLTSQGKSAHGAYVWEGQNAIRKMFPVLGKVLRAFPEPKSSTWETTVNLAKFNSGDALNRVPEKAEVYLDIRYRPEDNPKKIVSTMRKFAGRSVGVEVLVLEPPVKNDAGNPYIKSLQKVVKKHAPAAGKLVRMPGSADTRFLTTLGIPAVSLGPTGKGLHQNSEYVELESLEKYSQILEEFVLQTA